MSQILRNLLFGMPQLVKEAPGVLEVKKEEKKAEKKPKTPKAGKEEEPKGE